MKYKYFVVSDVHGHFDLLKETLEKAGFDKTNSNHIFVSLGDLFDRGPQAYECLQFVNSLPEDRKILLAGNHELMLEDVFENGDIEDIDIENGIDKTLKSLSKLVDISLTKDFEPYYPAIIEQIRDNEQLNQYLSSLTYFYETKNHVFVHGWIPFNKYEKKYDPSWRDYPENAFVYATWTNCFDAWKSGVVEPNKTIVAGHVHTSYGHSRYHKLGREFTHDVHTEIFEDEGIIAIDAMTIISGKMNCFVVEDEEE